jgi:hypothetical protein
MAQHLVTNAHALRVRTAIGAALTAGTLLSAPVALPAIVGVAHASPADDLSRAVDAVKSAVDAHKNRVTTAQTQIKTGVKNQSVSQVRSGLDAIRTSKQQMRVSVQGIVRGALGGNHSE